ncbi:ABC-2 type transport system permease protein [Bacillus oleivorans]|uniref:ABC-2 type transport system permease protein n=1 Tax=Bacillus oleivorans TaxID=1448271 RepID=A0A285D3Y0_9BACI|nr:ABC transporter permease [Bacillus oleivorans]SNX73998.1 ABC-2 type transport system permease protein [Bacillus oleivorans]
MISLLQNEWLKAHKKNKVWLFLAVMGFLLIMGAVLVIIFSNRFNIQVSGITYTINSASVFTTIISFYSIVIAASSITSEYSDGTIKQLFIRAHSRTSILLSKYIIVNILIFAIYYFLIVFNYLLGLLFFGMESFVEDFITNLINGLYNYPNIMFYITLAFMIGAVTKSMGLATGFTFLAKFSSGPVTLLVSMYDWGKYVIFPHLSLSAYSDNRYIRGLTEPFMSDISLGFSFIMILLYLLVFIVISIGVTEKRDIL